MATLTNSSTISVVGGTISFVADGDYTFAYKKFVQVLLEGGQTTNLTQAQYESILALDVQAGARVAMRAEEIEGLSIASLEGSLDIAGVGFREAGAVPVAGQHTFEASINLDSVIGSAIAASDAGHVVERLTVDGSKAEAFMLVWDYLDDAYVAGGNYYDLDLNLNFARLGIAYVEYLEAGGAPLTDVTAKFAFDGADAGTAPDRLQSMHDNLLGNVNAVALQDRFGSDPGLLAELLALVPDDYEARAVFSGNESARGGAAHDAARAFDYERGWERDDWIDTALDATVDAKAQDGAGHMLFGSGNSAGGYAVVRHEGAGVELALKAKERGGPDYAASVDADGTVRFVVAAGTDEGSTTRAAWNLDFAATSGTGGQDETSDQFVFRLLLDVDPTAGTRFIEIDPAAIPDNPVSPWSEQNSTNYGFGSIRGQIDGDPDIDGVQPYDFGAAEFDVVLEAYDGGALVASNRIVIEVSELL